MVLNFTDVSSPKPFVRVKKGVSVSPLHVFFVFVNCQDNPNILMPDGSVSKKTKGKWLLEICEDHVKRFVFHTDELTCLINQTSELEKASQQTRWGCRADGCDATYTFHSGRVR